MIYATYSDASDDWGDNSDITDQVIFGGIDGALEGRFTVENSPYVITGGVHVSNRLRIDPGVTIKLFTWTNIDIYDNSSLVAIGTEEDSITFERHELYTDPSDHIWYGIQEYNWCCNDDHRDTLILKYVNIHDASNAVMIRDWENNSTTIDYVEISNSRFSHNGHGFDIEKYDNGNLFFFESNTLQNGKKKFVNLYLNKNTNKFKIKGSSYTGEASNDCVVGNWWNMKILSASKQISPLSGSIKEQVVSYVGEENLIINGTTYITKHFTLKSKNEDLPKDKKLNFNIWLSKENNLIMKVTYSRMGDWEYNLKNFE